MNQSSYLESLFSLSGKVAVVIGGTGELCGAMAEGLAGAGAEVVLVGRNPDKAKARLDRSPPPAARHGSTPPRRPAKPRRRACSTRCSQRSGRVDVVVNGAGINSATPFFDISEEEFLRILDVNVKGVFLGCQVFGKYLVERGEGGSIINLGSMSGIVPLSRVITYSASKGAVHNLSLNLAREWAPHRVRVNVLVPGFFPAEQNRKILSPDRVAAILGHTPSQALRRGPRAHRRHAPARIRRRGLVHHRRGAHRRRRLPRDDDLMVPCPPSISSC